MQKTYNTNLITKALELTRLTGDRRVTLETDDMLRPKSTEVRGLIYDLITQYRLKCLLNKITQEKEIKTR